MRGVKELIPYPPIDTPKLWADPTEVRTDSKVSIEVRYWDLELAESVEELWWQFGIDPEILKPQEAKEVRRPEFDAWVISHIFGATTDTYKETDKWARIEELFMLNQI